MSALESTASREPLLFSKRESVPITCKSNEDKASIMTRTKTVTEVLKENTDED